MLLNTSCWFYIPGGYRDDDDELLQLAIQQSLVDGNAEQDVTLLEALGYGVSNDAQRYCIDIY